jgi:hypothetical protein
VPCIVRRLVFLVECHSDMRSKNEPKTDDKRFDIAIDGITPPASQQVNHPARLLLKDIDQLSEDLLEIEQSLDGGWVPGW